MTNKLLANAAFGFVALSLALSALAQTAKLPASNRTVFKCTVDGKVSYFDEPCLGAKRVDVEPTRGMNKSTGRELIGQDVRREHQNELFAEVARPITGLSSKQLEIEKRRIKLSSADKNECARLDGKINDNERREVLSASENRYCSSAGITLLSQALFRSWVLKSVRPNPSIKRTSPGKPGLAAYVKR